MTQYFTASNIALLKKIVGYFIPPSSTSSYFCAMAKNKPKPKVSTTLNPGTIKEVERLRKQEKRSFSAMADILLEFAIPIYRKQKGLSA
jgi:hypothetical protein